jgi:glycosyltransferase involved in cell wall biosynthesis
MNLVVANLTSGGLSGGYRKYLSHLMPLIAADPRVSMLTVFVPGGLPLDGVDVRPWNPVDARRGYASLIRDVAAIGPDLVFVPTARHVAFGSVPVVTMVRNMEPLDVPFAANTAREGLKNIARAWEARRAARRARRVIAVSEHVREYLVRRWNIDERKVGLAYHGVDRPPSLEHQRADDPPTLFTAGSIRPARGLEDAIRALQLVDRGVRLVIAGGVDPGCERHAAALERTAAELGVADRIAWRGQLDEREMSDAFRAASVFLMTSRAEACPNTVLEAMMFGCASISVDHAPMPELFDGAARYYRAGDAAALAAQVGSLLGDDTARRALGAAAAARALAFSWEATRDRTIAELEKALA